MAEYRYVVCDVFTDRPLAGNPLAVFTDARPIPEPWLQLLAREINLSETVFVYPAAAGGHARIRIFTPREELPFAGHPVLGTAFVLAGPLELPEIVLETGAGQVPVRLEREGSRIVLGRMSQPHPTVGPCPGAEDVLAALGVGGSALPVELYVNGPQHVYVMLDGEAEVAALAPDLTALARQPYVVSCFAGRGRRWKTRAFAPGQGIPEDPATGSAAGPLAWHLARHGRLAYGEEIEIVQGVEIGRPSTLYARAEGSAGRLLRIEVSGAAVIVARGEFRLSPGAPPA